MHSFIGDGTRQKWQTFACDIQPTPGHSDCNLDCPIELRLVELAKPVPLRLLLASPLDDPRTPSPILLFLRHTSKIPTRHSFLQLSLHLLARPNDLDSPRAINRPQRLQRILRPPIQRANKRTPLRQTTTINRYPFPPKRLHLARPRLLNLHIRLRRNDIRPRLIELHHHFLQRMVQPAEPSGEIPQPSSYIAVELRFPPTGNGGHLHVDIAPLDQLQIPRRQREQVVLVRVMGPVRRVCVVDPAPRVAAHGFAVPGVPSVPHLAHAGGGTEDEFEAA